MPQNGTTGFDNDVRSVIIAFISKNIWWCDLKVNMKKVWGQHERRTRVSGEHPLVLQNGTTRFDDDVHSVIIAFNSKNTWRCDLKVDMKVRKQHECSTGVTEKRSMVLPNRTTRFDGDVHSVIIAFKSKNTWRCDLKVNMKVRKQVGCRVGVDGQCSLVLQNGATCFDDDILDTRGESENRDG